MVAVTQRAGSARSQVDLSACARTGKVLIDRNVVYLEPVLQPEIFGMSGMSFLDA